MIPLDQVILKEANPFDPITFRSGNFWNEDHKKAVDSIHQNDLNYMSQIVSSVVKDQKSRSIFLTGDSGCGKSYLLGRLKRELNPKAFFVYVDPCPDNEHIWRHTLRRTVDSLMYIPEGETESQLQLWLKGLSAFKEKTLLGKLLGEKAQFVGNFCATYPSGIYEPKQFFSVLYELAAKPENHFTACEWLKGANLDEEDLKILGVKSVIDSETAARGIIANFGRIADATKPIVLCFDQVESAPTLADKSIDISPSFKVNTTIHNEFLRNFCVIISVIKQSWELNKKNIPLSDLARFETKVELKKINLEQALALWKLRLSPLHEQINPKPTSEIEPLTKQELETSSRSNKINLRTCLQLGNKLFSDYKSTIINPPNKGENGKGNGQTEDEKKLAFFQLTWQHELTKQQKNITHIKHFSTLELKQMLKNAMECLGVKIIQDKFLPSPTFKTYSFIFQHSKKPQIGLFWYEEASLKSLNFAMEACAKSLKQKIVTNLTLIRAETLGKSNNAGYKKYQTIFHQQPNCHHICPHLDSVHYLRTYQVLENAAATQDLIVNNEVISLEEYQELVRKSEVLKDCVLLQDLGIIEPIIIPPPPLNKVKEVVSNLLKTNHMMGKITLINNVINLIGQVNESDINQVIQELCDEAIIRILNPQAKPQEQSICLLPQ
jgi:hypothetical protein